MVGQLLYPQATVCSAKFASWGHLAPARTLFIVAVFEVFVIGLSSKYSESETIINLLVLQPFVSESHKPVEINSTGKRKYTSLKVNLVFRFP